MSMDTETADMAPLAPTPILTLVLHADGSTSWKRLAGFDGAPPASILMASELLRAGVMAKVIAGLNQRVQAERIVAASSIEEAYKNLRG